MTSFDLNKRPYTGSLLMNCIDQYTLFLYELIYVHQQRLILQSE